MVRLSDGPPSRTRSWGNDFGRIATVAEREPEFDGVIEWLRLVVAHCSGTGYLYFDEQCKGTAPRSDDDQLQASDHHPGRRTPCRGARTRRAPRRTADGPGRVVLEREHDVLAEFAGQLTVSTPTRVDALRDEWD